jgi:hypothetical protein
VRKHGKCSKEAKEFNDGSIVDNTIAVYACWKD